MEFSITATDGAARAGRITLAHGTVDTPAFIPVGTYGTVKAMSPAELKEIGTQVDGVYHRNCAADGVLSEA